MGADRGFSGARLRLARAFNGWTQSDLGEQLSVSHQYIGYLETGHKVPTPITVEAIGDVTGFDPEFFFGPPVEEFRDEECHFRRRVATPVSVRSRVLAHGSLFGMLVSYIDTVMSLPAANVPDVRVKEREDIERAAERTRIQWGLGKDLPVKNLTRAVERAGVVVTRFAGYTTKVDAFSRAGRRDIVVLNTDKDCASRARFDLGHECGHLVMHGGRTTGDADTEREADQFSSALLLPRAGFVREFPRSSRPEWEALFRLKARWGASVSAIVRRAYDLRMIDAAQYQRTYKAIAARGWLRGEPDDLEPEIPEIVSLSLTGIEQHLGSTPAHVCSRLRWRAPTFERVVGVRIPTPPVPRERRAHVVQLSLVRAERQSTDE